MLAVSTELNKLVRIGIWCSPAPACAIFCVAADGCSRVVDPKF